MVRDQFIKELITVLDVMGMTIMLIKEKYGDETIYSQGIINNRGDKFEIDLKFLMTSNYNTAILATISSALTYATMASDNIEHVANIKGK